MICNISPGAGLLAWMKYLREQSTEVQTISRDYQVWFVWFAREMVRFTYQYFQITNFNQTRTITRNVDVTFCKVDR